MRRTQPFALVVAALGLTTACYTYAPAGSAAAPPEPGRLVAFDITDAGRVALASGLGSGAERVEGELVSRTDSLLTLRVTGVRYRDGASARWSRESFGLRPEYVATTRERRFSRGRTLALAATALGALAALMITQDLSIFGTPGRETSPIEGGPGQ